jgi:hypothetical protein
MDPYDPPAKPVVADEEVRLGIDDAEVIAKTLPAAPPWRLARSAQQLDDAMDVTRAYVARKPLHSMLIAAAAGAGLTALALAIAGSGDRRVGCT